MKPSKTDQFNAPLLMRGLTNALVCMSSQVYEFAYHLTFKKAMKALANEFTDSWQNPIDDAEFFDQVDDPIVKSTYKTLSRIIDCTMTFNLRHSIDQVKNQTDQRICNEAKRFPCYYLISMRSKSYKRLKLYYERALGDFIHCLYFYASALTVRSNNIPMLFRKQYKLEGSERLRFLNTDDNDVCLLIDLINGLAQDLADFKILNTPKSMVKSNSKKAVSISS